MSCASFRSLTPPCSVNSPATGCFCQQEFYDEFLRSQMV